MLSEIKLKQLGIDDWSTLSKSFTGADLLLGNGFSLNITGHFNYKSLFEEFLKDCETPERHIFRSFKTNNFERIQEILIDAKRVNELFGIIADKKIDRAIVLLKSGLIKSIHGNHPRFSQIDRSQLQRLSKQINNYNFNDIFTLNYDLFLYHLIMHMKDESEIKGKDAPYSDYFWGGESDEQLKKFMNYDYPNRKHVYYLHGALFLFMIPPGTFKIKRGGEDRELVSMIGDQISNGIMPLFVSEGNFKEKLKTIERSNYLSFCYESLEKSENKLIIFGSSLSSQDIHVVNAINYKKNIRDLAIAVHVNDKSKDDLEKEILLLKGKFKYHKIFLFDSKTIFNF